MAKKYGCYLQYEHIKYYIRRKEIITKGNIQIQEKPRDQ